MRNLPPRPSLKSAVLRRLQEKTEIITQIVDEEEKRKQARTLYDSARSRQWFRPVLEALRGLCGDGELCMYCSSNEPSQIEHYRPLSSFPEKALNYDNYLWTCDICNRTYKQNRFPPDTEPGEIILNPLEDNVWDYFFLDEQFGRLIKRLDPVTRQFLPRAASTCDVVGIDRENVQKKRQHRYRRLRQNVQEALDKFNQGVMTSTELCAEIEALCAEPFQADVADYFLRSYGRIHEPFRSALAACAD